MGKRILIWLGQGLAILIVAAFLFVLIMAQLQRNRELVETPRLRKIANHANGPKSGELFRYVDPDTDETVYVYEDRWGNATVTKGTK